MPGLKADRSTRLPKLAMLASEALRCELQVFCKCVTAPYKYPRQIGFIAEPPKTITDKIRFVELRTRAAAEARNCMSRNRHRRKFLLQVVHLRKLLRLKL